MSGSRTRGNRDLVLVVTASVLALLLALLPLHGLIPALILVPAVLFLPGYALAAAMFPAPTLSRAERLAYAIALSVGATVLGGLVWQLAFGLGTAAWASILTAMTLAACEVARRRRAAPEAEGSRGLPRAPRVDAPTAIAVLAAVVLAVLAVRTAIAGEQEQRAESHFTALWIVPSDDNSGAVEVGLANHQGTVHEYRLTVTGAGRVLRNWEGRLGSRAQGHLLLEPESFPPGTRLIATLFRDGASYRRVELQTGAGS